MNKFTDRYYMGFFKDMNDSAVNFSAYRSFAGRPWGQVISYLVLLVLLLGTPVLLSFAFDFNREVNRAIDEFSRAVPNFVLKNGELHVSGKMPLVFEEESDGRKSIIAVDTGGKTNESILQGYETGIFISRTKVVNKRNRLETQIFYFSNLRDIKVTKADVEEWLPYLKLMGIVIVIFGFFYFLLAKLCSAAVLGLVCLLFSRIQQTPLTYGQGFKISVYALTLPTIFQAMQNIILPNFFYAGLVYYVVLLLYLWFAVQVNKEAA